MSHELNEYVDSVYAWLDEVPVVTATEYIYE